ncbi:Outer membrane vitamin B12 receptor BtuB [Pseudoalteromonas luteoviolacea B = ATCC 29581]|nr:Outer membrane vitamin B12 receptor BtuB [Pseudoalteromonas luteoviolacea B = ATCC 29581]
MFKLSRLNTAIIAVASLSTSSLVAQEIERITVNANKIEQNIIDVAASILVIDRLQIEKSGVNDLPALLSQEAGFQINRNGGLGQNSGVSLRGASTRHTLILIDGIRVGSATLGYKSLSDLSLAHIDRIEIIKGSRAALYGSDALAGVINVITRRSTNTHISVGAGSQNQRTAELSAGNQIGPWQVNLNTSFEKTDGFDVLQTTQPDKDGYANVTLGLAGAYESDELGKLKAQIHKSQGEADYDSSWGTPHTDEYRGEFDNSLYSFLWEKQFDSVLVNASLSQATDSSEDFSEGFSSVFETTRHTKEVSATWFQSSALTLLAGLTESEDDVSGSSTKYELTSRTTTAFYAGATYSVNSFSVEGFARNESDDQFGDEFTYSLGLGYQVRDNLRVYAQQSTGFKAPTFNDLYYPNSGNAALEPEQSQHQEIGVKGQSENATFETAFFTTDYTNKIAWAPNASGQWQPANINAARHQGVELRVTHDLFGLDSSWNYSYLDANDQKDHSPLIYVSKNTLNWRLAEQFDALEVATEFHYRGDRMGKYDTLPSYTLINLVATYQLTNELSLNGRIENLFDKEYNAVDAGKNAQGVYYYNTMERRLNLTLRATF